MSRIKELWGSWIRWRDASIRNRLIAPYVWAAPFAFLLFIFLASGADGPITPFELIIIPLFAVAFFGTIFAVFELFWIGLELIFPSLPDRLHHWEHVPESGGDDSEE